MKLLVVMLCLAAMVHDAVDAGKYLYAAVDVCNEWPRKTTRLSAFNPNIANYVQILVISDLQVLPIVITPVFRCVCV